MAHNKKRLSDLTESDHPSGPLTKRVQSSYLCNSPSFKFQIGPDETPFYVHENLFERISQPLHTMINNGSMRESVLRFTTLSEVDSIVFARVCDFAYFIAVTKPDLSQFKKVSFTNFRFHKDRLKCSCGGWRNPQANLKCSNNACGPPRVQSPLWYQFITAVANMLGNTDIHPQGPLRKRADLDTSTLYDDQSTIPGCGGNQITLLQYAKLVNFADQYLMSEMRTICLLEFLGRIALISNSDFDTVTDKCSELAELIEYLTSNPQHNNVALEPVWKILEMKLQLHLPAVMRNAILGDLVRHRPLIASRLLASSADAAESLGFPEPSRTSDRNPARTPVGL